MDAFTSSSSTINGTSATGGAVSASSSSSSQQSSGALPSCNYNYNICCNYNSYNQIPPPCHGHGAFMQQQHPPPRPYYNYNNIPTRPPPPASTPYFPLYPYPYNSNYFNPQALPSTYPPSPPPPPPSPPLLPLMQKIAKQIDYYFCDDNLAKDEYLRKNMDEEGWVPIALVAGFRRVSQVTKDTKFVLDSLVQLSCNVEVKGDKIRRRGNWKKWLPKHPKT